MQRGVRLILFTAALRAGQNGRTADRERFAFEAFMAFESSSLHGTLAAEHRDPPRRLEARYIVFREGLRKGEPVPELEDRHEAVLQLHDRVRRRPGDGTENTAGFASLHPLFVPKFDRLRTWLGIDPSLQSRVLVVLLVVGLVHTFSPRRRSFSG